jgi:hypothetical protein
MTTDLKAMTPREARLGRWILLYGILQVLSTISVDVQGLKHTDGVRYLLCTDLKRCPEWVTNSQIEYLEASQMRSWCWQRSWDPTPTQTAPVELDATPSQDVANIASEPDLRAYDPIPQLPERHPERHRGRLLDPYPPPPPLDLDGPTLMQNDIRRINEKINDMSLSQPARQHITSTYETRRENEKAIHSDLNIWKPRLDSLPHPPHPTPTSLARQPERTPTYQRQDPSYHANVNSDWDIPSSDFDFTIRPLPRTTRETMDTDLEGYQFRMNEEELQWPVPPGYTESDVGGQRQGQRESGVGYSVSGMAGGNAFLDLRGSGGEREDMERREQNRDMRDRETMRSPRRVHERGGW